MKKRLLITSIVMMLVVAVALSTATYAWFTSNATVSASTVSLTAATNSASSIGISWQNSGYGTSIAAVGPEGDFDPMAPSALTVGATSITAPTAAGGVDFWSGNIKQEGGTNTFNSTGIKHWGAAATANQVAPYVWGNGTYNTFFLKNLSDTRNIAHVTLSATVDGKGADLIRIAVFARIGSTANSAPEGTYVLKKILSNATFSYSEATTYAAGTVYYTNAQDGTTVSIADQAALTAYNDGSEQQAYTRTVTAPADSTAYCTDSTNGITAAAVSTVISANSTAGANDVSVDLGALNANCIAELIVYVWTDGTALVDARGGEVASIKLDVSAS